MQAAPRSVTSSSFFLLPVAKAIFFGAPELAIAAVWGRERPRKVALRRDGVLPVICGDEAAARAKWRVSRVEGQEAWGESRRVIQELRTALPATGRRRGEHERGGQRLASTMAEGRRRPQGADGCTDDAWPLSKRNLDRCSGVTLGLLPRPALLGGHPIVSRRHTGTRLGG